MTAKIIYGKKIAEEIINKKKEELNDLISKFQIKPTITTIKIGDDSESNLYLKLRDNACKRTSILSKHLEFTDDVSEIDILRSIMNLNKDENIHGILIQFPIHCLITLLSFL